VAGAFTPAATGWCRPACLRAKSRRPSAAHGSYRTRQSPWRRAARRAASSASISVSGMVFSPTLRFKYVSGSCCSTPRMAPIARTVADATADPPASRRLRLIQFARHALHDSQRLRRIEIIVHGGAKCGEPLRVDEPRSAGVFERTIQPQQRLIRLCQLDGRVVDGAAIVAAQQEESQAPRDRARSSIPRAP
jgi:hypothetical protein